MADPDAPLDTSGAGAVPFLSYPVPGVAHGSIPGLLGVVLNGEAPPTPEQPQGGGDINVEDLRNKLLRRPRGFARFAERFDASRPPLTAATAAGAGMQVPPQAEDFPPPPQPALTPGSSRASLMDD